MERVLERLYSWWLVTSFKVKCEIIVYSQVIAWSDWMEVSEVLPDCPNSLETIMHLVFLDASHHVISNDITWWYILIMWSWLLQGGPSTQDEMCLSFLAYYPSVDLSICSSLPLYNNFSRLTRVCCYTDQPCLGACWSHIHCSASCWLWSCKTAFYCFYAS